MCMIIQYSNIVGTMMCTLFCIGRLVTGPPKDKDQACSSFLVPLDTVAAVKTAVLENLAVCMFTQTVTLTDSVFVKGKVWCEFGTLLYKHL